MTAPLAWLIDTDVAPEMMPASPELRVVFFLDFIAEAGLGLAAATVWELLDDHLRYAFLAAAAVMRSLAVVMRNAGDVCKANVGIFDPRIFGPK